jgi:hypothetical protein
MYDAIQQVINDSIASGPASAYARQYSGVVDKVAADVSTHISKCGEDAIEAAVAKWDVDADEVRSLLVDAGLAVEREPETEVPAASGDTDRRLTAIEQTLARLSALAERAERSGLLR